ncbi:MAG: histidine kinase [Opitutus sp.]
MPRRFAQFLLACWCLGGAATGGSSAPVAPAHPSEAARTWISARKISALRFYRTMDPAIEYSEVRVKTGDDPRWAEPTWEDNSWQVLTRTGVPKVPVRAGIMWVRFRIRCVSPDGRLPEGFLLWNLMASYDVFWDGRALAHSGRPANTRAEEIEGGSVLSRAVPSDLAGPGEHVVAIRLSSHHVWGAPEYSGLTLVMMTPGDYDAKFRRDNILPVMASSALFTIAIVALAIWVIAARQRVLLYFGAMCSAGGAFVSISWYTLAYNYPYSWKYDLQLAFAAAALALNVSLGAVILEEWTVPRRRWWLAALLLMDGAVVVQTFPRFLQLPGLMVAVGFGFVLVSCGWAALHRRHGVWLIAAVVSFSGILLYRDPIHFVGSDFFQSFLPIVVGVLLVIVLRLRTERLQAHETKLTAARLEIELLKKNLQPHFLMNTLTALAQTVEENPALAVRLIDDLAEEFRTVARISSEKIVPLAQELALCRAHLKVMRARTDLDWQLDADGVDPAASVPPAVFLTLIENSFSHQRATAGATTFALRSVVEHTRVRYRFRSPGAVTLDSTRVMGGTGLRYIRARLEESFPGAWSLGHGEVPGGWETVIELRTSNNQRADR